MEKVLPYNPIRDRKSKSELRFKGIRQIDIEHMNKVKVKKQPKILFKKAISTMKKIKDFSDPLEILEKLMFIYNNIGQTFM